MGKICDPPAFSGGQAPNILYRVRFRQINLKTNQISDYFADLKGAITGLYDEFDIRLDPITQQKRGYTRQGFYYRSGASNYLWREGFGTGGDNLATQTKPYSFQILSISRLDGLPDTGGDPPPTNCRCSDDSCRVDCATAPDGFCCIDNSFTDRLLQILKN